MAVTTCCARPDVRAAISGGLFLKPNVWVARRRAGAVVTIGTAGSLLLLGAGSAVAASRPPSAARLVVSQGIGSAAMKHDHVVGQASGATKETVSFILRARNLQALESSVGAGAGRHLSVGGFVRSYGRTSRFITELTKYLAKDNIKSSVHADHLDITTTGTAADYNKALGIPSQSLYRSAAVPARDGRAAQPATEFHGTTRPLTLPASLAPGVLSILGLTNYSAATSNAVHTLTLAKGATPAVTRAGEQTPSDFAGRYDLTPLLKKGAKGQGETIGIVTLASLRPADATHFWSKVLKIKTKANRIKLDNIDGGAGPVSDLAGSGETSLDVEQSGALAPDANIIVYQAPNTDAGFIDAFATAASQNKADVVSSSWGESEDVINAEVAAGTESRTYAAAFDEMFLEMAAQGQSSFIAAGDAGAYDSSDECVFATSANNCIPTTDLSVDNPGDSPYTTDAGGMTLTGTIPLSATKSAVIKSRRAWGWDWQWPFFSLFTNPVTGKPYTSEASFAVADVTGGGGGYSAIEPRPAYQSRYVDVHDFTAEQHLTPTTPMTQSGFTAPTAFSFTPTPAVVKGSGSNRAVPDVSANADPYTGYLLYFSGQSPALEPGWGGTSFVAPQFAGATAVMDSYLGHRVGFWNPQVYRFASFKNSPFDPVETTSPNNDNNYYTGTAGHRYTPAAGLGTPDFAKMTTDFRHAEQLRTTDTVGPPHRGGPPLLSGQHSRPASCQASWKWASSSSVISRDRIRKRTPSGASTEKPLPRPGTTSTVRWVCFQYSYCETDIQNGTARSSPATGRSPRCTSASPISRSPSG
jgi:kumamolisin